MKLILVAAMSLRLKTQLLRARFLSDMCVSLWIFLISVEALARAGGAGGGHVQSSHDSYSTHSVTTESSDSVYIDNLVSAIFRLPWYLQLIIFAAVAFVLYRFYGRGQSGRPQVTFDVSRDSSSSPDPFGGAGVQLPPSINPPMSEEELRVTLEKVRTGFTTIQDSWSQKTTAPMRRFISDGVYQRFNAQFVMMNLLDQTNRITDLSVLDLRPVNFFLDGPRECLEVAIKARAFDQFVSEKHPQFNSPGGRESFGEVWSLIRQRNRPQPRDIFAKDQCPQCGADITNKLQETASCPFCGTAINNGEYDWVVAEITQLEPYMSREASSMRSHLQSIIDQVRMQLPQFSRQDLEDRTSNAFLQILIGTAARQDDRIGRFSSERGRSAVTALQQNFLQPQTVFNRLYLSSVELRDLTTDSSKIRAEVAITCVAQRLQMVGNDLQSVDADVKAHAFTVAMVRTLDGSLIAKGSIYANTCPQCGGPQKDTLNLKCSYCSAVLNDPRYEWILDSIETL